MCATQSRRLNACRRRAPLTILGELVHNPVVRERLSRRGVREGSLDDFANAPTPQVMITAHGASEAKRRAWRAAGYAVADGTCPLVSHAHDQLRRLVACGYFPIVIGQHGHVEVQGLTGDFPGARVIANQEDVLRLPRCPRYGVISQTTQPIDRVRKLVAEIERANPEAELRFVDTVCKPTKDRQRALHALLAQVQLVVVVGGHHSNNTRQLAESCRAAGRPAIHIEEASELRAEWFDGIASVGLTAGTSTLIETVEAVHERLREIAAHSPAVVE